MDNEGIVDTKTEIQKNPRHIYKLTYDEFEACKSLQKMLFSDMGEKDLASASDKIKKIVKVIFPEAAMKDLKSSDPKLTCALRLLTRCASTYRSQGQSFIISILPSAQGCRR